MRGSWFGRVSVSGFIVVIAGVATLGFAILALQDDMPLFGETQSCEITDVVDGDTVALLCGATQERGRVLGLDAPELFSPKCAQEATAAAAAKHALGLALGQATGIKIAADGRDRYDRLLIDVYVDGVSLADRMIAQGHARPYGGGRRNGWC